jgi:hypothetical protein
MNFPTLVYRCPGAHQCEGNTFDYAPACDESELGQLIKDGWWPTLPLAMNPPETEEELEKELALCLDKDRDDEDEDEDEDEEDLSRADLEAIAEELGINFPPNIKDENLLKKIREAGGD